MSDIVETKGMQSNQIPKNKRNTYDANYKLIVIQHAEKTCNRVAARKFDIDESCIRRWRKQKEWLLNANTARRAFTGPQFVRFVAVQSSVCEYIRF